jgi:hypothetical protein
MADPLIKRLFDIVPGFGKSHAAVRQLAYGTTAKVLAIR